MSLFKKKVKKQRIGRTFEIPEKEIPKFLRLLDTTQGKQGTLPRYEFWRDVGKIIPGTIGVNLQVNFRGSIPFLEEVL